MKKYWCIGIHFVATTRLYNLRQHIQSLVRSKHETINVSNKSFWITNTKFRHIPTKHPTYFYALLLVTQMLMVLYDKRFQMFYNEAVDLF
jgi:hypothetical protein